MEEAVTAFAVWFAELRRVARQPFDGFTQRGRNVVGVLLQLAQVAGVKVIGEIVGAPGQDEGCAPGIMQKHFVLISCRAHSSRPTVFFLAQCLRRVV